MIYRHVFIAAALLAFAATPSQAQPADSMLGTWKLNVAKSKSPYKSGTSVVEAVGDGVKVTADMVGADGTAYHWTWTAKYDGKDVPITGTTPFGAGTVAALTRVDARTAKIVTKLNGKVTITQTLVVSDDGRTRTITTSGKDAKGRAIESTAVYEKQ